MKAFMLLFSSLLALLAQAWSVPPVLNYAGQVAVNGEAFNGNGLFKFALVNADGMSLTGAMTEPAWLVLSLKPMSAFK